MIDQHVFTLAKTYGPGNGTAICLGDQRLSPTLRKSLGTSSTETLFKILGYEHYLDIDYNGKAKLNHDLSYPIPEHLTGSAQLVYDGGTLEHVANISQAFQSLARMIAVGGVVIQIVPLNNYGASYFAIDPAFQRDFFVANGFECLVSELSLYRNLRSELMRFVLCHTNRKFQAWCEKVFHPSNGPARAAFCDFMFCDNPRFRRIYPAKEQHRHVPSETHTVYVGRRIKPLAPTVWPHQSCYEAHP